MRRSFPRYMRVFSLVCGTALAANIMLVNHVQPPETSWGYTIVNR